MADLAGAIRDIPLPPGIAKLRRQRGFPVPWFVSWLDGEADFRVADGRKFALAHKKRLCWICGQPLGRINASVIGPMCAVNRISSEPPSHLDCARYAARACPFLSHPRAQRNAKELPEQRRDPAGIPIDANPGVTLIWISLRPSKPFDPGDGGVLFQLGKRHGVEWWCESRPATRAEVEGAFVRGLPALAKVAALEGEAALQDFTREVAAAMLLMPAESEPPPC
jgi:hypothetical protein